MPVAIHNDGRKPATDSATNRAREVSTDCPRITGRDAAMKYRIHFLVKVGDDTLIDSLDIEGDTPEEIQTKAVAELESRGVKQEDAWSEPL
jgi:hypothetical protein